MKMEVRPIDANELIEFPYSEASGTEEQIADWIETCGLDKEETEEKAKKLCWTVIEGFINLIKTAPTITQPNEWISVESPPKERANGTDVLILRGKSGFEEVGLCYNGLFWSYDEDGDIHYADDVTYWAHLPAPPEEER